MKYKIIDRQFDDRYYGGGTGVVFNSKKEICEQLISYHSNDCNMVEEQKLLDNNKINKCLELLFDFEWELEEIIDN